MLNANYTRILGLRFYQQTIGQAQIFSGESPDVIRHELGHAVLDALRPQLFDAASIEVDAFHEAFGDMSSILAALQVPSFRAKVMNETRGRLNVNSRLSRVAEQLAWGIRQLSRDAVDRDCLRNAANRFLYRTPGSLPPQAPATQLSTEPHSLARVFTGAFLDALAAMVAVTGPPSEGNLEAVSRDMGQLLVDGVLAAPVVPTYFSQVAAAMVQAARVRNGGRYWSELRGAFVERGLLSLESAHNLDVAIVPSLQQTAPAGTSVVGAGAPMAGPAEGSSVMLQYGNNLPEGFQSSAADTPVLPLQMVDAEFLDEPIQCHVPTQPTLFTVGPSMFGSADAVTVTDAADSARHFLATLIQLGRIDPGAAPGIVQGPISDGRENWTHKLEPADGGPVLKRIQFQRGFESACQRRTRRGR
jgi:hypothetical protein